MSNNRKMKATLDIFVFGKMQMPAIFASFLEKNTFNN
jgi:hypothetical protein